jgi:hypothetical protein
MGNDLGKNPKGGKSAQVACKQRSLTNRQCEYSQQVVCAKLTCAIHDMCDSEFFGHVYWYIQSELGQLQSDNFQTEVESDFI